MMVTVSVNELLSLLSIEQMKLRVYWAFEAACLDPSFIYGKQCFLQYKNTNEYPLFAYIVRIYQHGGSRKLLTDAEMAVIEHYWR